MPFLVESEFQVTPVLKLITDPLGIIQSFEGLDDGDVMVFVIPPGFRKKDKFLTLIQRNIDSLPKDAIIGLIGENEDLASISYIFESQIKLNYQYWITLRKEEFIEGHAIVPNETAGLVLFSKNKKKIKLAKVRLPYTYCPACQKTTKDYGGKKHTFHEYGTLMSDVWKDIVWKENEGISSEIINRLGAMLSTQNRRIFFCPFEENLNWGSIEETDFSLPPLQIAEKAEETLNLSGSLIMNGDAIKELSKLPDESIDYVFVDPPYNLKKKYSSYEDDLEIEDYFTWCDRWLEACIRTLKPGKYLSILNIPQWSVRHFAYLSQQMEFESWTTWDSLSRPGGNIMPANYTILTFKKMEIGGEKKELDLTNNLLKPAADYYCLRAACKKNREPVFKELTDLWTDIHRVKHNSFRYDHPCQLPPDLMKRLIEIYSEPNDYVLDCFNGVGTTTLSAEVMGRKYVGIELDEKYATVTKERHVEALAGLDPFRKNTIDNKDKAKNNELKRVEKRQDIHQHITKKAVQLEIKKLSQLLKHIPSKDEALEHLKDIPEEFYNLYFSSWAEVTSAARVNGVTEYLEGFNRGTVSSRREDTTLFSFNKE